MFSPYGSPNTLAGQPTMRSWVDIWTMDAFLSSEKPNAIVELGTGNGAYSTLLALYCQINGATFLTIDVESASEDCARTVRLLEGTLIQGDVFSSDTVRQVQAHVAGRGAFIYCDGGNKPKELLLYSEVLKSGDHIGTHDYLYEVQAEDLKPLLDNGWRMWNQELFAYSGSFNRILEKL